MKKSLMRWTVAVALLALVVVALAAGRGALAASNGSLSKQQANTFSFTFNMVPASAAIQQCLPHALGTVTITKGSQNDELTLHVVGLAPSTGYDLFVLQIPHAPFGIAWYQSDLETNSNGEGTVSVRGIFNIETFSISPGTVTTKGREGNDQTGATFGAVNQYHLGLWFNDPQVPFNLGCEPGRTLPLVTPFNGEQHAGILALNTSNFPDSAGPLRHVPA